MKKSSLFVAIGALLLPASSFALTVAPMRATTSSAPARAVASSSAMTITPIPAEPQEGTSIEPDEIDVADPPQEGSTDYLLEIGGVEGESTKGGTASSAAASQPKGNKGNVDFNWKVEEGESAPGVEPDEIDAQDDPQEASTDYLLKLGGVEGESTKGNVPGVEPDEIDVATDPEPLTPDFGILLGGGSSSGDDEEGLTEEQQSEVAEILLQGLQEQGAPAETLSLNYEKIKTRATQLVKFLGFIPMTISATVEIDAEEQVKVKFPWWSFLVSGKDGDSLGQQIFTSLSNVLKTKHDTVKNAINNVR